MSEDLAIRLRGVVKRYGPITAVDHLDLDVPVGTCVGLLGPNGAGKSTTMRLLTAQSIADEGELEVLGFQLPRDSKDVASYLPSAAIPPPILESPEHSGTAVECQATRLAG